MSEDRGRNLLAGASAATLVSALIAFGPGIVSGISGYSKLKADVEHLTQWRDEHLEEHGRLREWLRRLSDRQRYNHGGTELEPPPAAPSQPAPGE